MIVAKLRALTFAGLLGAGLLSDADAVHVASGGSGQALLFALYTTERMDTLLTLRSAADTPTVLSVSIREGELGTEALAFFVYLAPHDSFTAALTDLARLGVGSGPGILVPDDETTCTVPEIGDPRSSRPGRRFQPLLAFESDAAGADREALRSGHIEVMALGQLSPEFPLPIDGCLGLAQGWGPGGPLDAAPGIALSPPTPTLSGHAALVDVSEGESYSYPATALAGFRETPLALHPIEIPDLAVSADVLNATVDDLGGARRTLAFDDSLGAVSAALAANALSADVNTELALASTTEVVVTLPTYHAAVVQPRVAGEAVALAPFERLSGEVYVEYELQDRRGIPASGGCEAVFLMGQTLNDSRRLVLMRATTSIPMGAGWDSGAITGRDAMPALWSIGGPARYFDIGLAPTGVLRVALTRQLQPAFFCADRAPGDPHGLSLAAADADDIVAFGLPVLALTLTRIRNGTLGDGSVLANYGLTTLTTRAPLALIEAGE